jgi:hypothetical protein
MVRKILLLLLLLPTLSMAEIEVVAKVIDLEACPFRPLKGKISISSDTEVEVDDTSFKMGGRALKVNFLGQATQSSVSMINGIVKENRSTVLNYFFELPGQGEGLHSLDVVEVNIEGKIYFSVPMTYEVRGLKTSPDFILEAFVDSPRECYPGQRFTLRYRIAYKDEIEVTYQHMPLLEAKGLKKVGEYDAEVYFKDGYKIQEISQNVEAVDSGKFAYGPSMIEGYTFKENFLGQRSYNKPKISAEAKAVIILVEPFPKEQQPGTFMGASGDFILDVRMLTPGQVHVGDKVRLEICIEGVGSLDTLRLPDISKQNGFEDFRFSDLPPVGKVDGMGKQFILEIRPLTHLIREIPEVEFSFFDPSEGVYKVKKSNPILLEVDAVNEPEPKIIITSVPEKKADSSWRLTLAAPAPISIVGNFEIGEKDLSSARVLRRGEIFYFVPVAVVLLLFQWGVRNLWHVKRKSYKQKHNSEYYYNSAFHHRNDPGVFCFYLEKSLLLALYEYGHINTKIRVATDLPEVGFAGKVKLLLESIVEGRFAGGEDNISKNRIQDIQDLYGRVVGDENEN